MRSITFAHRVVVLMVATAAPLSAGQVSGTLQPRLVLEDGCVITAADADAAGIEVSCSPGSRLFRVTRELVATSGSSLEATRITVDW